MFEFTECIWIDAAPNKVWKLLMEIESWWPPSNPEHIRIEVRSPDKSIDKGTEVVFEERVAGIKCRAEGRIRHLVPGTEASWEGIAQYRYVGLHIRVNEGVSWRVDRNGATSRLSARVWAEFPSNRFGRFVEWYAKSLLNVVDRDRQHARHELEYLKHKLEDTA